MSVKKGISLFVSIVAITVVAVLYFSIDASTFNILKHADTKLLLGAFALVICGWILDSLKFICLLKVADEKISFRNALYIIWVSYFGCAITPMQSGGGPFQVYMLYRYGISVGKSFAVTLVRTVQTLIVLAMMLPFAYIVERDFFIGHTMLKTFVGYVFLFISVMGFLIVASFIRPDLIHKISGWIILKFNRFGFIKPNKLLRTMRFVRREINSYSDNIRLFIEPGRGRLWLMLSFLIAIVHMIVYMSVMPCLIVAMGFHVEFIQCILAESLFLFLLYFVPTPGASGAAEGGATAIFALFVPWNLAGVMAVTWRLATEYSGITIGSILSLKMLGWGTIDSCLPEGDINDNEM